MTKKEKSHSQKYISNQIRVLLRIYVPYDFIHWTALNLYVLLLFLSSSRPELFRC